MALSAAAYLCRSFVGCFLSRQKMAKVLTEEQWQVHRNRKKSKVIEELLKSQDEHKNVSGDVRKTREKLPIYDMRQEIIRQIEERQIIIIEGEQVDIFLS